MCVHVYMPAFVRVCACVRARVQRAALPQGRTDLPVHAIRSVGGHGHRENDAACTGHAQERMVLAISAEAAEMKRHS